LIFSFPGPFKLNNKLSKANLSLYSPYYAEECNEFAVPISVI